MNLIDQEQRDRILENSGDLVVSASAGSGKTTIMVKKMGLELEKITDHRTIAAITFTVKATDEIKRKAKSGNNSKKPIVVMTNDSFIESEIIRPFIKDAFGKEFGNDYSVEYANKYKFDTYSSGLKQLKSKNILGSFEDNKRNFNFKLALEILKDSVAAQEYIRAKYAWIFLDEYQDSDGDMHRFFMQLNKELNIKLFIVGDSKQAIYLWRGAMSNVFDQLDNEEFDSYELVTNFRCDKEIENYANLFHNPQYVTNLPSNVKNLVFKEYNTFNSFYERRDFVGFVDQFKSIITDGILDLSKEVTIIANYNNDAKKITELLNKGGFDFVFIPKTPIDEGIPNGYLLKELALYSKNSTYTIYDFLEKTSIDERVRTRFEVNNIIRELKDPKKLMPNIIEKVVSELANYLGITIGKDEINKFCDSICNEKYDMAFRIMDSKYKVMTVFASKGLEFDQVISFARYYKIYNDEDLQNHYVCITRAKEKFIMFIDNEAYIKHVKEVANKNNLKDINKLVKVAKKNKSKITSKTQEGSSS
ncbi:UvrD-helicase domain-containing protein [Bacillus velezensis]|uniref:UvrD-helicase domain-containing protein n=1 Tax=Bacillus velezensis TaxID=492670 RepID=UPI00217676A5|nr:UvrD-helicase domain-containing protein [Bacillus velezensis]